jgi:membrane fusion protein, multidrug efflux system
MKSEKDQTDKSKKSGKVYIPLILVVVIVIIGAVAWYRNYSKFIYTDDAYVDGDNISLSSKVTGRISVIKFDEGDTVPAGSLIVVLDSSDLSAQKKQVLAAKEQAVASKDQASAKYLYDQESINVLKINLDKAQTDFERSKKQMEGSIITQEQYEHSQKAFESAKAQFEAAKVQLNVSKAQVVSAEAYIKTAEAQVGVVESQLRNLMIFAPVNSVVAKKWLLPGEMAQAGQTTLTLTDNSKYWITVYLEETKLGQLHLGQNALFTLDTYPGITFTGKVNYISANTASQFSLIPPNNASGNFTKITQRVPVKISIDGTKSGKSLKDINLISGMSAVVKIIKE